MAIFPEEMNDLDALERAFQTFEQTHDRSTLIIIDSHIGYGAPHKHDTNAAYGEPLGEDEIRKTKRNYGWLEDAKFLVPDGVQAHFQQNLGQRGQCLHQAWMQTFEEYRVKYPELADQLYKMQHRQLPDDWDSSLPIFAADAKGLAGRDASAKVLNAITQQVPWLIGGADQYHCCG